MNDVHMIVTLPPPMGGAAKNNAIMAERLKANGGVVHVHKTSVSGLSHNRSIRYIAERILKNLKTMVEIRSVLTNKKDVVVYIVPDGGFGVYFSAIHLILFLAKTKHFYIHHRTFKYIAKKSFGMQIITSISKLRSTHIFLSEGMACKFEQAYGLVSYTIVRNTAFSPAPPDEPIANATVPVIGFISNICAEKGIFEYIEVCRKLKALGLVFRCLIAGDPQTKAMKTQVERWISDNDLDIEYVGQVSGSAKEQFYRSIDVLVFPTKFKQEAQPNVIYEALSRGCAVISTDIACIPEMLTGYKNCEFLEIQEFVEKATQKLASLVENIELVRENSIHRRGHFLQQQSIDSENLDQIITSMIFR